MVHPVEPVLARAGGAGRDAHDVGLDDEIVRAADEQEVLDVVPPQEDELALAVEVVDVDDAEPGLARAPAVLRRHAEARSGEPPKPERQEREEAEDDREGDHVLDRRGGVDPES